MTPRNPVRLRRPRVRRIDRATQPASATASAGIRPSKSRGQNFLTQPAIAARIVAAAQPGPHDEIVEIGPGLGILSETILAHPVRRLLMIELDSALAARLRQRFEGEPRAVVLEADFLEVELPAVVSGRPIKVVGNLPFNAAAAILRRLCEYRAAIARMVLMFQREVAMRIRARPGDDGYGALSVYTALYWEIVEHFRVAAGSFFPRPKVDAEMLVMTPRAHPLFRPEEEPALLAVVRAAFRAPRKIIRNNLTSALALSTAEAEAALRRAQIESGVRAETLESADFVRLTRALGPMVRTEPDA